MNELALFSGAGGGILGGHLLGWRCVCAVEYDAFCARRLMQRQNESHLPPFPIWDDVRTFNGHAWRGVVDVVSGGFPCQDISAAGKGAGIEGDRSGLWVEMARIIREVQPRFAFVENSPMLTSRGLGVVLGDLAEMGFDARWGVFSAADAGAPHLRERIWIMADAQRDGWQPRRHDHAEPDRRITGAADQHADEMAAADSQRKQQSARNFTESRGRIGYGSETLPHTLLIGPQGQQQARPAPRPADRPGDGRDPSWWLTEPDLGRVAHGVAARVDQLRALGNGQVPAVAALAWRYLTNHEERQT